MSSSFQSTAFRSSARPVDTFVAEPSVLPKTGAEELASILQTVNPNLQKFLSTKIEKQIDEEKIKFQNIAIQEDLIDGIFGDIVTETRKKEGSEAADQLIGASVIGRKAYAKQKLINSTFKIDNVLENRYKTDTIDITNLDGTVSSIPLNQISPDSTQFKSWFEGVIDPFVNNIPKDTDPEILNTFVFPQLQKSISSFNTKARKEFNTFNKNKLIGESTDTINTAAKFFLKAQTYTFKNPETKKAMENDIKINLENLIFDMKNAGITGTDLSSLNETLISNIVNIGELSITQGNFRQARSLVNFLSESIPGSSAGKTLKDNPKWLEKTTDFFSKIYEKEVENTLRSSKLQKAKRQNEFTSRIEDYRSETDPIIKSKKYEKLNLDFPEKEFQSDIDEFGQADNQSFNEKANQFIKDIRRGFYLVDGEPDTGSAFLELDKIERLDLTPDSASKSVIEDLEKRINNMKGYAKDIEKYEKGILDDAKSALSQRSKFGPRTLSNKDAKLLQRYERILQDEADERMSEFEEENGRPMFLKEVKAMYRELDNLLKFELGVLTEEEAGVNLPQGEFQMRKVNFQSPFAAADRNKNPIEETKKTQNKPINKALQDDSFDIPQLKSETPNEESTTEIANNIATGLGNLIQNTSEIVSDINTNLGVSDGDMLAMVDTSAQENIEEPELNYSEDSRVQSILKAANELGISPIPLAAVIAQESSFRPSVVSTDKATGKQYKGLIQFGPYEIERYNIRENMSFEDQMIAVTNFLKDRGVQPGHGAKEIYAAIFTGNVSNLDKGGANWEDSNGTTVNKALPNLLSGGSKYKMAIDFLQQTGIYQNKN
tara:strand:+ start:175 stop:2670 length:2496 start_codon:yes stop_codon:yes gene_type:complete